MIDVLSMLDVFHGEHAPYFVCAVCNLGLGARRVDGVWSPSPCWHCDQRAKARDAAKRRREGPRVLAGVDVDRAAKALRRVPVLAELLGRKCIQVNVGHRVSGGCGGRAWTWRHVEGGRIRIYSGPETTQGRVLEVVLHELCHVALPGQHHNERFRRVFARACREAWGIEVPIDPPPALGVRAYGQGEHVAEKLNDLIATSTRIDTYPPEVKPQVSKAERAAALVDKRAAHAAAMLAKAERKLRLAKTVHKRWLTKVRYYERAAAKRGS